jgi:hypothetical protein
LDTHEETSCSQLADVFREDKEEMEQQEGQFISCLEPGSEQPSSEVSQPASASHPPMPTKDIQPCVISCGQIGLSVTNFLEFSTHYMSLSASTWSGISFISWSRSTLSSTSTSGGKLKDVIILLSRLHHLLFITDKVDELPVMKLLEWIWWKFAFT